VTTLEVVYYLATGNLPPPVTADACPHSLDGRCMVRRHRPLGCRVFYCRRAGKTGQERAGENRPS